MSPTSERPRARRARVSLRVLALVALATITFGALVSPAGARGPGGPPSSEHPTARRSAAAPAASGPDLTLAQFQQLAARAETDPAALAALRRVRSVDGEPVEMATVLGDATGQDLTARLRVLAGAAPGGGSTPGASTPGTTGSAAAPPSPAADRRTARRVLSADKYHPTHWPRPFRGVLQWLGDRLRPVFEPIGRFFSDLSDTVGGKIVIFAGVCAVAAALGAWLIGRRSRAAVAARAAVRGGRRSRDPDALERAAEAAEAAGDLERAVRLRFQAGLLRLDQVGALRYRADATTGELRRTIPSPTFGGLAEAFDEIVYGERPTGTDDIESARRDWPIVLHEVKNR